MLPWTRAHRQTARFFDLGGWPVSVHGQWHFSGGCAQGKHKATSCLFSWSAMKWERVRPLGGGDWFHGRSVDTFRKFILLLIWSYLFVFQSGFLFFFGFCSFSSFVASWLQCLCFFCVTIWILYGFIVCSTPLWLLCPLRLLRILACVPSAASWFVLLWMHFCGTSCSF